MIATVGSPVAVVRARRSMTALSLRLGMAVACLPVVFFAAAVQLGVARNDATVDTVTVDAIRGITVAQDIKLNLAELDEMVVDDLLGDVELGANGYPTDYDLKRGELHDNLVQAASISSSAAAFRQPLANIDYALGHYHTLVRDAFAADAGGDTVQASALYGQAHDVMAGTLLSAADFVDKANTYVLNDTYDTQHDRSASTVRLVVLSWAALVAFLVVVQVLVTRTFHRLVNLPIAVATVVAIVGGGFAVSRLDASAGHLSSAREQAFDSVHVLAQAGATVVSARQSEGQLLLDAGDPARAATAQDAFDAQAHQLFRVQDRRDVAELAQAGAVPDRAGGFLATVAAGDMSGSRDDTTRRALVAFGDFLAADGELRQHLAAGDTDAAAALYRGGAAFTELGEAIDEAQAIDQATFDAHAGAAARATAALERFALAVAAGVLGLVLLGLYQRLKEYGT